MRILYVFGKRWFKLSLLSAMILYAATFVAICYVSAAEADKVEVPKTEAQVLAERAYEAQKQKHYEEAAQMYEVIATLQNMTVQDETWPLSSAAHNYAWAKQYEKAIELWERVLEIPAAPGAHPPGMANEYTDWRGEARWNIAEARRTQGRWQEALELYRLNRVKYPRDDGCVNTGAAFQQMALVEAICLENLGRYDEAVEMLWPAMMQISSDARPIAMRHLVELYAATNQSSVLNAAVARERENYVSQFVASDGRGVKTSLDPNASQALEIGLKYSSFPTFDTVRRFRQAAREKQWPVLLAALQNELPPNALRGAAPEIPALERREAILALATVSEAAVPVLESALKRDKGNRYLQVALLWCRSTQQKRLLTEDSSLDEFDEYTQDQLRQILREITGYQTNDWQFSSPPPNLQLPTQLPAIYPNR